MSRRPGLEPLERRHLLSVALAEIDSTLPADGSALLAAPQQIVINFDPAMVNQFDDLFSGFFGTTPAQTLAAIIALDNDQNGNNQEFELDRVGIGGVTTPLMGGDTPLSPLEATLTTVTDADGNTTQSQMILTPAAGDPPFVPGTYQLDILPGTLLDAGFSFIDPSPVWTSSQPTAIAQFTVLGQGASLGDAAQLGDLDPLQRLVTGFVDPQGSQTQVALYQFSLPQGNRWQLNAQVLAQAIGSPLSAGLTLFDADGNAVATSNSGQGHADDPNDPFLIEGLAAGTYYLGVSAAGNLPGRIGGYDIQTAAPGTDGFDVPSGAFWLELSARPVLTNTTVTSDNLDYADPLDSSPTGLDLTFSGPIDASPLFVPDQQETGLEVVDDTGWVCPITPVNYVASTDTLSFIFDEPLRPGNYSLIAPAQGGLTDLSGQPLVVPAGNPSGELASWTVAPSGPSEADNLDVVWPGPVNVTWDSAIARTNVLVPGQEVSYRFVVICPGVYEVQTQVATGQVDLEVTGADGTTVLDARDLSGLNESLMTLGTGVYSMNFAADGTQPAVVQWVLNPIYLDYEKIVENGVGQAPVLTVLVTVPTADSQGGATADSGAVTATSYAGSNGAGSNLSTLVASPIPTSLLVSMTTGLMGMPGTNTQNVAAVGPMAEGALAAVADRANGLLPGIMYTSRSDSETRVANGDPPEVLDFASDPAAEPQAPPSTAAGPANPEAASARNDGRVLAQADRLVGIASWIQDAVGFPSRSKSDARPGDDAPAIAVAAANRDESRGRPGGPVPADRGSSPDGTRESLVLGDLRAPLGLIAAVAIVYRLRRPIENWWRRKATTATVGAGHSRPHRPFFRGPHSRTIHAGTTIHQSRMPRTPS